MRTPWIRRLSGVAGLLAAVAITAKPALTAAPEPIPDTSAAKLIEADVAFLKKGLDKDLKGAEKRSVPGLRAAALNIALYGKDDTRAAALKVADALAKKDFAGAKALGEKLPTAAGTPGDADALIKASKLTLGEVMAPFKADKFGGMNLEADTRKQLKKATDVKQIELIAARTTALGEFMLLLPSEKAAANDANKKKWDSYSKGMLKASRETLAEAAKGDKADKAKLEKGLRTIDATCTACHNEYRD